MNEREEGVGIEEWELEGGARGEGKQRKHENQFAIVSCMSR